MMHARLCKLGHNTAILLDMGHFDVTGSGLPGANAGDNPNRGAIP